MIGAHSENARESIQVQIESCCCLKHVSMLL